MRVLPLLLLAGCAGAPPSGGGGGIVSTNPCADAMLVQLVPHGRIAAISHYSKDPAATSIPLALANRFDTTAGTAEEVLALQPDLVIASSFTPPPTRDAYARAGLRTLYLDSPQTVAASVAQVRELSIAVGAKVQGEQMVARIDRATVAQVPPRRRPGPSIGTPATGPRPSPGRSLGTSSALLYINGDLATGAGTLLDELLTHAGFRNAAADYGLAHTGNLPAETLVTRPPVVIIAPPSDSRRATLRHKLLPHTPEASFPRHLVNCAGPSIPAAMARLRAIRATL